MTFFNNENSKTLYSDKEYLYKEFKIAIEKLAQLTNEHFPLTKTLPYSNEELNIFSNLSLKDQTEVLNKTKHYVSIWIQLISEKYDLKQEKQFLWRVLQNCGHMLGSNALEMFKSDEIVEVYALDGTHIWYNLKYMEVCSHTIEEIRSIPWTQRYERLPHIEKGCHEMVADTMAQKTSDYKPCTVEPHIINEIDSTRLFTIKMELQNIAPIYQIGTNNKSGFIVTSRCNLLEARRSKEDFESMHSELYQKKNPHLKIAKEPKL